MWRLGSRLAGKKVVVIGAAGNLGPVWVDALLAEGADVVGCGLGVHSDPILEKLMSQHGEKLDVFDVDLGDAKLVGNEALLAALSTGEVHGIVLNAGIDSVPGSGKTALTDYSFDDWHSMFAVNVFGVVSLLNLLIPYLAPSSSVVTVGSMYGVVSPKPDLYSHFNEGQGSMKNPAYGASKAALLALTKQYATYLAPQGIRLNMLTLGGVRAGQDEEFVAKFEAHVPQGRMVPSEELPGALLFLLSDDSLSMTGQNVIVDGGYTTW